MILSSILFIGTVYVGFKFISKIIEIYFKIFGSLYLIHYLNKSL